MLMYRRPDPATKGFVPIFAARTPLHTQRPALSRAGRAVLLGCAFLAIAGTGQFALAQGAGAQKAIERLEKCSQQERKRGCVSILKRKQAENGRQAIKAQVRGSRIIWYEYDPKTGSARRTN